MAYTRTAVIVQQTAATTQVRRIEMLNIRGRFPVSKWRPTIELRNAAALCHGPFDRHFPMPLFPLS